MKNKFVLISHILPPSPSGQAVMLYRLLSDLHPSQYCLVSKYTYRNYYTSGKNWMNKLSGRYYSYESILQMMLGNYYYKLVPLKSFSIFPYLINKYWGKKLGWIPGTKEIIQLIRINLDVLTHALMIHYIVKKENCRLIIACSGDIRDLPAAFLVSKLNKINFIFYSFDDFELQWSGLYRDIRLAYAKTITPLIFRNINTVIVTNELLKREYYKRYGINSKVIYNPAQKQLESINYPNGIKLNKNTINIIYTGAIYQPHYDAFSNLAMALILMENTSIRLHLFTDQPIKELENVGLTGPKIIYHPHIPYDQVPYILNQADILFLPLGFKTPYPELIKTSFPGKMTDYLSAGKPILVYAPSDSFVAKYFASHQCGLVVDKNDPFELMRKLSELISNNIKMEQLAKRALKRAKLDFNLDESRKQLHHVIKEAIQ